MKVQLLITAMVLGVCVGLPVKPEPRKFVYQVGYPSVRRYPVYPDRLLNMDQPQMLLKMAADKKKDIKNELAPLEGKLKPEVVHPKLMEKPQVVQVDFMPSREEETSTTSWLPVESELTTTYRPVTTPEALSSSFFEATTTAGSVSTPLSFSFTPQPSSFESESSISSSSSFSNGPTSPDLSIVSSDSTTPVEPATPEGPTLPEDPIVREPVSSSFGVFTEVPEEATDTPMTTALPMNELIEEERMVDPTIPPQEEAGELEELPENNTDASLLEQTVTEAEWDPVTQEIYTTEETEAF